MIRNLLDKDNGTTENDHSNKFLSQRTETNCLIQPKHWSQCHKSQGHAQKKHQSHCLQYKYELKTLL